MSEYSKIYWLTRLDYLQGFFVGMSIVLGLYLVAHIIIWGINAMDDDSYLLIKTKTGRVLTSVWFSFAILCACLIPNKNEAILIMVGGKTMEYVSSDSSLKKLPYQTTAIISQYMDNTLKEMKK